MRNILLFINNVAEARGLAKKAIKIANQCKANLQLCNVAASQISEKLVIHDYDVLLDECDGVDIEDSAQQLNITEQLDGAFVPVVDCLEINSFCEKMFLRNLKEKPDIIRPVTPRVWN